jgi:hypothetical protein
MGSITTGEIGDDPFYRFPSKLREPWSSTDSEAYAPMSDMEFAADKPTGGGTPSFPFEIVPIDETTIAIRKGTVSNIVPTIGGTPLKDDYTLNTITVSAATTFWLNATLVGEIVTAVAIVTIDPGADTATQAKQTLGSLSWVSGAIDAISSNLGGSQSHAACGTTHWWEAV